jgi:hypothetical protein
MSTTYRSRNLVFGIATVFAVTLLAPLVVTAEEEVAVLAPVAAPSVADPSAEPVRSTRALAAERVLQSGDIGSLQEEYFLAIVAPGPSPVPTVDFGSAAGSRVVNAPLVAPATGTTGEQTLVLVAQQALLSHNLGSMQEEALIIVVTTGIAGDETRSADNLPAALASGTRSESAHLAILVLPD